MRAVVKDGIGVFYPQGFLDGNNAPSYLTIEDIRATEDLKIDMLLVSLKKVIFFNLNGIDVFVKLLHRIRTKNHISIGICDYDQKKYEAITTYYKDNLSFSLFKTQKTAELFSKSYKNQDKTVLLYNNDPSQRSALAIELYDNGHNPVIAQTREDFLEKSANPDAYYDIIEDSHLGLIGQKVATRVTGNAIIYTVSGFLDAEIGNSFNILYHNNSLNVGFRLFIFDAYKVLSLNIHAVNFLSKLCSSAAEYNATICFVGMTFDKTPAVFKEELEDAGMMFFDNMDDILQDKELLEELGGSSSGSGKNKRSLTKIVVQELPDFIEATVSTIAMMTNAKAVKRSADIQKLFIDNLNTKMASSIGFYGDIDGMIILIFQKNVAKKSCALLIGEETDDVNMILDALAEFVNIIGGRAKTLLSEKHISIDITLPRTYSDVSGLLEVVDDKKGVQVDMSFNDANFTFFLTR
ncbi:chemotaxis protein CheX [Sulfurimonas sp. HSL-1716]|uniref:chemotaxis protein CheX n=1 Tax=Hydrocurvibacter sulfurireducens TaxID=3131937 RepID=UPI0031F8082A